MGNQKFPREKRIRRREDFLTASRRGIRRNESHFFLVILPKETNQTRLGLTVSRKVGGAVERNRIKRLIREFFRKKCELFPGRGDFSVVAKKGAAELDYKQVWAELDALFSSADTDSIWQKKYS